MSHPSPGTPSGSSFRTAPSSLGFPAQNGSTWGTESTADVYREKRNVVTAIWTKVADKVNSIKMTLGRERREDFNHGDWDDPVTEVVDADERPPLSPPQSSRRSMAATPPLDADSPQPERSPLALLILGMLWTVMTMAWVTSLPRPATCHRRSIKLTRMTPTR